MLPRARPPSPPPRVVELFCGIGGCAAALEGAAEVVAAVDINRLALAVYGANFGHPTRAAAIESLRAADLAALDADLWWLSPPCQPFTRRGLRRDLADPRAAALPRALELIEQASPPAVALENVPGFETSAAAEEIRARLTAAGYEVATRLLCPTELGIPNRRRRVYLLASRQGLLPPPAEPGPTRRSLASYLDPEPEPGLEVAPELLRRYRGAVDLIDPTGPQATAATFTSAYGRSPVRSGSYLRLPDGGARHFAPREIARLLGFPARFGLPAGLSREVAWRLLGNSLSVAAVREALRCLPGLGDRLAVSG